MLNIQHLKVQIKGMWNNPEKEMFPPQRIVENK